jgi:riboflavin synthase
VFTGIIEEVAQVRSLEGGELIIECSTILEGTQLGDSIAVNGVDLTVRTMDGESLTFDVMPETFRLSNLAEAVAGASVNLERSLTPSTRISGHMVRGVIEATCTLDSLTPEGDAVIAKYHVDSGHMRYIILKGPVSVDGASLTVVARDSESFSVSLVQYTQENTNLTGREPGDRVNLETDIMARYVEQLLEERAAT